MIEEYINNPELIDESIKTFTKSDKKKIHLMLLHDNVAKYKVNRSS